MGTRSLTRVIETYKKDDGKEKKILIITMYRQYDGYPSGHGDELASFLKSGRVVNGIGLGDTGRVFNGAGCLAAQMVSHFKGDSAGGFYLYPNSTKDAGQEYEYHVIVDFDTKQIKMICFEQGYMSKSGNYVDKRRKLFEGSPVEFDEYLKKESETP
jgi:hypothetical protein